MISISQSIVSRHSCFLGWFIEVNITSCDCIICSWTSIIHHILLSSLYLAGRCIPGPDHWSLTIRLDLRRINYTSLLDYWDILGNGSVRVGRVITITQNYNYSPSCRIILWSSYGDHWNISARRHGRGCQKKTTINKHLIVWWLLAAGNDIPIILMIRVYQIITPPPR